MAGVGITLVARQADGFEAQMRARNRRQRDAVLAQSLESADRVFARVQDLCPRDTHFMALHTRLDFTRGGFNWTIGWHAEDFLGETNPVNGRVITSFYPFFVVHGTRFMAGRDPLRPALAAERPEMLRGYARALA